jgi:L-ribulokinase
VEAGLSAVGDIFEAIARRAGSDVGTLSKGLDTYKSGQTGLLRLTWDNGDRTVLVRSDLGGITFGWNLLHTAHDELFAAIEGTAFHTRIILERMAEFGVPIERIINAGGIPQQSAVLNQVYANVLNMPVLVPASTPTSIGSGIFAQVIAGIFPDIETAQGRMCPQFRTFTPKPDAVVICEELYQLYRSVYFAFGAETSSATPLHSVLPRLREISMRVHSSFI